MSKLRIADNLALPLDAATQTFAFIARKGAGKTYAAGKLAELLLEAGVQVVILDTVGNWYGLRIDADGKGKGFDVPVFGGLRGDLPLQATAGELVADVAVDTGRSLILDLSQFSLADRKRFATAFGERLWRKKKAEAHPSPLFLVIEESQLIIPQHVSGGDTARMVGIYEEIVRLGRNYGIGCAMISQRPQSVNKDVLNQAECLFVLQVNGAQERKALRDWITHQGMDVKLLDELPSLPVGTAYVWSPQWLGLLEKVKIARKKTFDASATPKVGDKQVRRDPAPLDLSELEKQMAATVEAAKANDPRELRREIERLRKALGEAHREHEDAERRAQTKAKTREVPVLSEGFLKRIEKFADKAWDSGSSVCAAVKDLREALSKVSAQAQSVHFANFRKTENSRPQMVQAARPTATRDVARSSRHQPSASAGELKISRTQQRILDALAWFESIRIPQPTALQVGAIALIDATGGHFSNTVGPLSSSGLIVRGNGTLALTDAGRAVAQLPEQVATLAEYHDVLRERVRRSRSGSGKTVEILNAVIRRGGGDVTIEEIGAEVGIDHTGGHFSNTIGPLSTLGFIKRNRGTVSPTDIVFPPGLA